ncbi:M16 family metallopeptidase [Synechococcus elongatus]|uniref:Pitrilysin family protein n=1 Tax=Synechococcus elongatus PCC 11801 TaxID=2219813 RepID=A0AAN1UTH8_SYNEL|nr:pitrilysin family protein [Synechococcus elongatus]AZB71554.1 insulinase family protein [Synechococcus elongatus PCC 11801]
MIRRWLLLGIALLLCWLQSPAHAIAATNLQQPNIDRCRLDNGLRVYLLEDRSLPLVSGRLLVDAGSRLDSADRWGTADFTAAMLRQGSSRAYPIDRLDQELEERAASLESSPGVTVASLSFRSFSPDLAFVLDRLFELLTDPAFPSDRLQQLRDRSLAVLARQNDRPDAIASRELPKLIYGPSDALARSLTAADLQRVRREDLVAFHQRYYRPDRFWLGIVGDFQAAPLCQTLQATWGQWQPSQTSTIADLPTEPLTPPATAIYLIDQPQLSQSTVQMASLGGRLDDPDYAALTVLNELLNGFSGRLSNQIRSRLGLAYSVYGSGQPNFERPGLFVAGGQTAESTTAALIQALRAELATVRSQPISEAELQQIRDRLLNSFVFNFQSPDQTLGRLLRTEFFQYPEDFLWRYRDALLKVTPADVQAVAQRWIQLDQMPILVIGDRAALLPQLQTLNLPVQDWPLDQQPTSVTP